MTGSLQSSLPGSTPQQWARDFLTGLGVPATPGNVDFVAKWEAAESGGGGGLYNPLNTVQGGYQGESDLNSVGVKNYQTYADGIAASVQTWKQPLWAPLVAAFGRDDQQGAQDAVNAAYASWNGGPIDILGTGDPANVAGAASSSGSTSATLDAATDEHCLVSLPGTKLPIIGTIGGNCLVNTSQGRALLGATAITAGVLLIVVGLGFVAVGKNAGTIAKAVA